MNAAFDVDAACEVLERMRDKAQGGAKLTGRDWREIIACLGPDGLDVLKRTISEVLADRE